VDDVLRDLDQQRRNDREGAIECSAARTALGDLSGPEDGAAGVDESEDGMPLFPNAVDDDTNERPCTARFSRGGAREQCVDVCPEVLARDAAWRRFDDQTDARLFGVAPSRDEQRESREDPRYKDACGRRPMKGRRGPLRRLCRCSRLPLRNR
jgi:hypothetical protein